ncbi:carboxypeptidase regulatory-like domain-containing protein [Trichlorobacter lovleyi]|uniref:carboxypeptidase-like regulatory domain-containing protein n=1 Tax=Trichlorobacter lovleyi TaxID=313985 RepID=UPI002240806D|nr:carboxypeptidase-like regulatory domain-containing protein [Trichlorobacter lovleyi]QOX79591.1 carboxypeptidase regulatory-like domain-containing protein [Trichlorobacter lovleyi]
MKTRLLIIASLVLAGCLLSLAGCGGGTASFSSGNGTTGTITLNVAWPKSTAAKGTPVVEKMAGAVTVRLTISGPGMTPITKDFPVEDGQGTIDGVPVGTERVLKILGLDSAGAALYAGEVTNITVVAGQTSDAGTVVMEPVGGYSISGKVTLDGSTGLEGVTITAESSTIAYAAAALTASYSATTDANGDYTIIGLPSGTYLLTASKTDYTFTPSSTTVIIDTTSLTGQNFTGAPGTPYFPITVGNKWIYDTSSTVIYGTTTETASGSFTRLVTQVSTAVSGFSVQHDGSETSSTGTTTTSTSIDDLLLMNGNGYLQSSNGSKTSLYSIGSSTSTFSETYTTPGYIVFIGQPATGTIVSGSTTRTETITIEGSPSVYSATISSQHTVVGPETVMVPAGSFSAIRVSFTETNTMASPSPGVTTVSGDYWYAPYVGLVKTSQTSIGPYETRTKTESLTSYIVQ